MLVVLLQVQCLGAGSRMADMLPDLLLVADGRCVPHSAVAPAAACMLTGCVC
jgi:hypothetical protein